MKIKFYKLKNCPLCESTEKRLSDLGILDHPDYNLDCIDCLDFSNEKECDLVEKITKTDMYPILKIDTGSDIIYKCLSSDVTLKTITTSREGLVIRYPGIAEFLINLNELNK